MYCMDDLPYKILYKYLKNPTMVIFHSYCRLQSQTFRWNIGKSSQTGARTWNISETWWIFQPPLDYRRLPGPVASDHPSYGVAICTAPGDQINPTHGRHHVRDVRELATLRRSPGPL